MILKINGKIDIPKISISIQQPQAIHPVVVDKRMDRKINYKKVLISASMFLLAMGIKPLLSFASNDLLNNIPDGFLDKVPKNTLLKHTPQNLPKITGHDYTKDFWYRHSGVLNRIRIDKKHGVKFWERIGENTFNILLCIVKGFLKALGKFIIWNNDLFFLMPAVGFAFLTFFVGKNKYTKYILPLFFAYFVSMVFRGFLI